MPIPFGRLAHSKGPPHGAQSSSCRGGGDRRTGADLDAGGGHVGAGHRIKLSSDVIPSGSVRSNEVAVTAT
jgi:hypothetical protein